LRVGAVATILRLQKQWLMFMLRSIFLLQMLKMTLDAAFIE